MAVANIDSIVKEITSKLGGILAVRVYVGVANSIGQLIYEDSEMEQFRNFIQTFVKSNFKYLKVGDHSLPISGRNIMFFRTPKAMLVLYSIKGRVGQLLTFKSMLPKYMNSFDQFVGEVSPEVLPAELVVEEVRPEVETIPTVPLKAIEKVIFSRREAFYKEITPVLGKKIKDGAKFSLITSVILNYSNDENSILDISDKLDVSQEEFNAQLYKLYKANWIKIQDYELFPIMCPSCKKNYYYFVPTELLKTSPCEHVRFQIASPDCDHAFYVIIEKKGKIKPKAIPKIRDIEDEIDFSELSIEKLIKFFGQDLFFNLFHAIFFKNFVLFLESGNYAEKITEFMKKFFPQVAYGTEIQSLSRDEYRKKSKRFADYLVIDLNSNIVANEPYETEDLDFELRLFRKILMEEDEKVQILKTHSEFEKLILNTDTILNEIEMYKEIKEDELIELMKNQHDILIERSEIPIIKELADIYYYVNIRKKVTKTLVGQVSDWLEGI
ncbi:MAG: hypothetical protein HWN65_01550 [Candidatus Helarchaeota archaeon]|nr:hypothetical protein [Candidatus Helarchaeota archaeon]